MEYAKSQIEKKGAIEIIYLNRPEKLNALDTPMLVELMTELHKIESDPAIKVVILAGKGNAFCTGADISELLNKTPGAAYDFAKLGQRVTTTIENLPQPVICAIHGYALGGGCELALACDIRIMRDGAMIGQPEINIGATCGFGGTQRLPRLIGKGRASYLLYTGRSLGADIAHDWGLVDFHICESRFWGYLMDLAKEISKKSSAIIKLTKSVVNQGSNVVLGEALELERLTFKKCFGTADRSEGMKAFLKKRKPEWGEK